jgi:hypothetical protein
MQETKISTYLTSIEHTTSRSRTFNYSYLYQSTKLVDLTYFNRTFSLLPFLEHKASRSCFFPSDMTSFLHIEILSFGTELYKSSRILHTRAQIYTQRFHNFMMNLCTKLLLSQFPAITVLGPRNGTICWHRGRPRVQCYNNAPTKP